MSAPRSDFTFNVADIMKDERTVQVVQIVDRNLGNMSVTNDVENVVLSVAGKLPQQASSYAWIYRDSEGYWDEIILDDVGNFSRFAALDHEFKAFEDINVEAVVRLIAREVEART